MVMIGVAGLYFALLTGALAPIALLCGFALGRKGVASAHKIMNLGFVFTFATTFFLTICVGLIIYCFFAGDYSIKYVAMNHSNDVSNLAWLYKLAGLWGGREGSLLFWAWLISIFTSWVAVNHRLDKDDLSRVAVGIAGIVLVAFICVLVFSSDNNPFHATSARYLDASGNLTGAAVAWGMNALLEHWAMCIHPPTLFIGYAGMTIPFAYAMAALIVGDSSKTWVVRCDRITVFSWLFLGLGIGLGAVWAYVVLGWGGYWGWDPVENASLLSWLVGVALIHSFTIYRKRGGFKRWAIMCSCISFSFVILGTFITRSGLVESVHAFEGDPVSLGFFLALILVSLAAGIVGIIVRRKKFEADEEIESLTSKNTAYYFNNVLMVAMAVLLAYLTISSALPTWMPFGGQSLSAGTYNAIARPIGILYCALVAVCPLLKWGKTGGKEFRSHLKWPAIFATLIFAGLLVVFFTQLLPIYDMTIAKGGTAAAGLASEGPAAYYNGLAIVGFLVASCMICNTFFLFVRGVATRKANKGEGTGKAILGLFTKQSSTFGGYLTHIGLAIILVGLIGSNMYVAEAPVNLVNETGMTVENEHYVLEYQGMSEEELANGDYLYTTTFDVYDTNGKSLGQVSPSMTYVMATQQQKLNASTISEPLRDLFVVFQGMTADGYLSIDVKVNPLISFVWVGFAVMMIGIALALFPRKKRLADGGEEELESVDTQVTAPVLENDEVAAS